MGATVENEARRKLLHEEVATRIGGLIEQGTYRAGERIPSIRELSRRMHVSINTVMEAYSHLENVGMVEARPQSGYYVRGRLPEPAMKPAKAAKVDALVTGDADLLTLRPRFSPPVLTVAELKSRIAG